MSILLRQMMLDSPDGLWILNDAGGSTARDSAGNARNGTVSGSVTLGGAASTPVPKTPASTFNDARIDMGAVAAFRYTTTFTLECWIIPTGTPSQVSDLISMWGNGGSGASKGYILRLDGTFKPQVYTADGVGGSPTVAGPSGLSLNTRYHLVATHASAATTIFVNGVAVVGPTAQADPVANSTITFVLGHQWDQVNGSGVGLIGAMGYAAVYPTALSATRIAAHYQAGLGMGVLY